MQNDVVYLAMIFGLFGLMFALIRACDRIIGRDEEALGDVDASAPGPGTGGEAPAGGERVAA